MKETIAVISDIHGNACALEWFLKFAQENYKIDRILNLGDSVQFGPSPAEVLDRIENDKRFINILGNTDLYLLYPDRFVRTDAAKWHQDWVAAQLGEERLSMLKGMPTSVQIQLSNSNAYLSHTTKENLCRLAMEDLVDGSKLYESDYLLVGHTHQQALVKNDDYVLLNPGSLGASGDRRLNFLLIGIEDSRLSFEFVQLGYDVSPVIAELKNKKVPAGDELIAQLLGVL